MKFDAIRAVEACYARPADDRGWLDGLLEAVSPHGYERKVLAQIWGVGPDGSRRLECEAYSGILRGSELAEIEPLLNAMPSEARRAAFAPTPHVEYCLARIARCSSSVAARIAPILVGHGLTDPLGLFAAEPDGKFVIVAAAAATDGKPLPPARTLHQLTLVSAHLNSGLRLRSALVGSPSGPSTDAVLDPGGHVMDAFGPAQPKQARQSLAEAVRRMDRARGALRRSDPDEALLIWQGLVDGTWSLVDRCDSDGKRYVLARRNAPGVRDPKALTQHERAVASFVAMGHQNKFIGYLLGLSTSTVSGHLRSAERKLAVASRAELVRCLAPLLPHFAPSAPRGERRA